jgi:hypothetical protein
MATNWPNSVQTFTNPTASSALNSPSHADQHATVNDTVEALQQYAGMVFIKSVSIGSGVSSVTVTDAFSSTFDNYRLMIRVETTTVDVGINLVMGASTTGYYYSAILAQWAGGTGQVNAQNGSKWRIGASDTTGGRIACDIFSPYLATRTAVSFSSTYYDPSGYQETGGGVHNNTSQYTQFGIDSGGATMTGGDIRLYGYNNG